MNNKNEDLQRVLERVNRDCSDFSVRPAKTANDQGAYEDFPLHKLAIRGDVEDARILISHGANVNAAGEDNDTPLHRAIAGGKRIWLPY